MRNKETLAMLLCVLCWSSSGLFIMLLDWHPLVISGIRSGIAALFMLLVHGNAMFSVTVQKSPAPKLFGISAFAFAAVASAATKMLYVSANTMTSPTNAILLQHTAPLWAALCAGVLIKEHLRPIQWVTVFAAFAGAVIFFFDGLSSGNLLGDGIALLSGVTFGISMLAFRSLKDSSPARALFYSHLIPALIGVPFMFIAPPTLDIASIARIVFLGLVQVGAASLLWAYSIKRLPAMKAVFIAQLEPLLNPLWVFLFVGILPSPYAILGGIIIIAAVLMAHTRGKETV